MSDVMAALRASADRLQNDLASVLDHWQDVKRSQGQPASLGYEPRDIARDGAVAVISRRVLNASAGFEVVDPSQSYESLVLKYADRFIWPLSDGDTDTLLSAVSDKAHTCAFPLASRPRLTTIRPPVPVVPNLSFSPAMAADTGPEKDARFSMPVIDILHD